MKRLLSIFAFLLALAAPAATAAGSGDESGAINPKEIIFEHLGDGYGWEVPFDHHHRIPLPCIVWGSDGLHVFSSARITGGETYRDGDVSFRIGSKDSEYRGKIVEISADGKESRPFDISITKNVCALFISVVVVVAMLMALVRYYRRNGYKAPRKGLGFLELIIDFIYSSVIKSTLGKNAARFAPYLLTVFFFIFTMNLMGLMVVFPGGANLTGNIAITLVLALLTFLVTNIFGNRHYWKDIFWPDVPLWLKFPLPIMPLIEVFGMFTKPAALTVRLFANMMGGHMIVLVLTLLIFIFAAVSAVAGGVATAVSMIFSVFMLLIDVLVSFIQAYVFTMLSTIFISLANEEPHHKPEPAESK